MTILSHGAGVGNADVFYFFGLWDDFYKIMKMIQKIIFLIIGFVYIHSALADGDSTTAFELMQQNLLKNQVAEDVLN